jgi:hypothetical protein
LDRQSPKSPGKCAELVWIGAGLEGPKQRVKSSASLLRGELGGKGLKSPGKCAELVGIGAGLEGLE